MHTYMPQKCIQEEGLHGDRSRMRQGMLSAAQLYYKQVKNALSIAVE